MMYMIIKITVEKKKKKKSQTLQLNIFLSNLSGNQLKQTYYFFLIDLNFYSFELILILENIILKLYNHFY